MVDHHEGRKPDPSWTRRAADGLDDLDAPGFIISSKTQLSRHPLFGILKLQGSMEQCKGHRQCRNDDDKY